MSTDSLAAACGLYCGWCPLHLNGECGGCGLGERSECGLHRCCRVQKGLRFCSLCSDFPCERYRKSKCLHPDWVEELMKRAVERNRPAQDSSA